MKPASILISKTLRLILFGLIIVFSSAVIQAQTTAFTYQGRLTDGGAAANGTYNLQ